VLPGETPAGWQRPSPGGGWGGTPGTAGKLLACGRRALELLRQVQAADGASKADRLIDLHLLAGKLEPLLGDLSSLGTAEAERRPLAQLLRAVRQLLSRDSPAGAEVNGLCWRARAVLQAFAADLEPARDAAAAR